MKLGSRDVVILNTVDSVKEALVHRGSDFSGRPPLHTFLTSSHDGKTAAFTDFEPKYLLNKSATELAMGAVLSNQDQLTETALRQTHVTIQKFLNSRKSSFDPTPFLKTLATSILCEVIFGEQVQGSTIGEIQAVMDHSTDFIENSAVGNMVDFMPWIKVIFKKQVRKLDESVAILMKMVRKIYFIRKGDPRQPNIPTKPTFADALAKAVADKAFTGAAEDLATAHFDDETMINIIAENFGAGYEKMSTLFRWGVGYLVANRSYQEKLQKEIARVKGSSPISLRDRPDLPLLESTVLEVLRLSCFLPFGLPHYTIKDTSVGGYSLPKETIVFTNLWGCCRDPKYFDKPDQFYPERFMDESGEKVVRSKCVLAFSAGDRKCVGDTFSRSLLFLVLGTLLQKISMRNGTEEPIEEKFGLTIRPKAHKIRVQSCVRPECDQWTTKDNQLNLASISCWTVRKWQRTVIHSRLDSSNKWMLFSLRLTFRWSFMKVNEN